MGLETPSRHVDRVTKAAGGVALKNWKAQDIRAPWAELERERIGSRTRHAIHVTIRQALADAVRNGVLIANPSDGVVALRQASPNRRFLTPDQVGRLLEMVDTIETPRTIALVTLLAGTGLRIGEALALRWEDIDLAAAVVRIRRTLVEVANRKHKRPFPHRS